MLRRTNLIVGLLLVISAALVASSSTPSMAATASTIAATGKIVVTIRAPRGVPADVTLTGPRKTVFAKAAAGPSKSVSRKLPTGNYRVRPQPVISKGVLYQSPSHQIVTVAAGRTIRITVTFSRAPSASALHVTGISTTSISLAWSAPKGATFALRRTAGSPPAINRRAGTAVRVTGRTAIDRGLKAGKQYSYALFTHLAGRWAGPITLLAGTSAAAGSKTASFAAAAGTVLATPAEVQTATPTGSGAQVTLSSAVTTPVIGSAVVLPQSASLPGGYIGKVSGISADGSTLTLQPASLSDAISYYDINVPSFSTAATALRPRSARSANGTRLNAASCGGSSSGTVTFSPSLRLGGSFHAAINTSFLHLPKGASLSMELTATVTGAMSVEATAGLSCEVTYGEALKTLTVDPVPISILLTPAAEIGVEGAMKESNLGATVTGGVQFAGTLGISSGAHFSGSDILTAQPLTVDGGTLPDG